MTQHDCSRPGCTRLTSEQECDIHAAEPAGVVHQPKEPRQVPTLGRLLEQHEDAAARWWRECTCKFCCDAEGREVKP